MARSPERLKSIRFAGELLPKWAQVLDLAARLCPVPEATQHWFFRLTVSGGTDSSEATREHCDRLMRALAAPPETLLRDLARETGDLQPAKILAAWRYALETMLQAAEGRKDCVWSVEGTGEGSGGDSGDSFPGGGDITLRRP